MSLKFFIFLLTVICVAFYPVDNNYFIIKRMNWWESTHIWNVSPFRVVDYFDIREVVTSLCYCPGAKGAVIGSMSGECRFYNTMGMFFLSHGLPNHLCFFISVSSFWFSFSSDNQLEMDRKISLHGDREISFWFSFTDSLCSNILLWFRNPNN